MSPNATTWNDPSTRLRASARKGVGVQVPPPTQPFGRRERAPAHASSSDKWSGAEDRGPLRTHLELLRRSGERISPVLRPARLLGHASFGAALGEHGKPENGQSVPRGERRTAPPSGDRGADRCALVVEDGFLRCRVLCAKTVESSPVQEVSRWLVPRPRVLPYAPCSSSWPLSSTRTVSAGSNSDSPLATMRTAFTMSPPLICLST